MTHPVIPIAAAGASRERKRQAPRGRRVQPAVLAEVQARLGPGPHRRDHLIELLHRINDRDGQLGTPQLAALAQILTLPQAEIFEELRARRRARAAGAAAGAAGHRRAGGPGTVTLVSRRGPVTRHARADDNSPPYTVFVAFGWFEAAINRLTNPALDPVARIPEFKYCAVKAVARGTATARA